MKTATTPQPGEGWRLLEKGEPLKEGDGFMHPDQPGVWIDYVCRPAIFTGRGYCPKNETAHTWPWRRKTTTPTPTKKGKKTKGEV